MSNEFGGCHIRWLIRRDMAEVLAIEDASFDDPWSEDHFLQCLRQRNTIGMVGEIDSIVVSFMIYKLMKTKLRLVSLAVRPDLIRNGIGKTMVERLKDKLGSHGRHKLHAELPEGWLPAQLFLKAQGFTAIKITRNVYDTGESAYLFEWRKPQKICVTCERPASQCECEFASLIIGEKQ